MSIVRNYILERGRSPNPDTKTHSLAPALKQQCDQERQELTNLNDRLSNYIDRIKTLEDNNKKLQDELNHVKKTWGDDTRRVIDKNEPELDKARNKVDELSRDAAKAQIRSKRQDYNTDDLKRKADEEAAVNAANKNKIKYLENLLEQNKNELDLLRNRVNEKQNEIDKHKKENDHLNYELNDLLKHLDDEQLKCAKLRSENQTLEEQIPFINAVHEQEINEMKALADAANLNPAQFFRQELEKAIRDIKNDFEQLNDLEKREMEEWYKIKIDEVKQLAARQEPGDDTIVLNDTLEHLRNTVRKQHGDIVDTNAENTELEAKLRDLQRQLDELRNKGNNDVEDMDRNIGDAKQKLNDALNDRDKLLAAKNIVDFEINAFKRLGAVMGQ